MKLFIIDAFTDKPFGGNPAGVVLLDSDAFPKDDLMLSIASELRYSETAFIRRHSAQEYTIRYFTPKAEVDLCGHATIASFHLSKARLWDGLQWSPQGFKPTETSLSVALPL